MRTVAEYKKNAEECRRMASTAAKPEDRKTLEELARAWERLAKERESALVPEEE